MSQQNGVLPQASIETTTTPPSHPQLTTSGSQPSILPSEQQNSTANVESSAKPPSDSRRSSTSGTITGKVEIPKLSAATTELLARVTGGLKGGAKNGPEHIARWSSPSSSTSSTFDTGLSNRWIDTQADGNMKASAAFLELSPASFTPPPAAIAQSSTTLTPAHAQENHIKQSAGLINLAPKPGGTASSQLQTQTQMQSRVTTPRTAGTATIKRRNVPIAPRPRQAAANGVKRGAKRRKRGDDDGDDGDVIRAGDSSSDHESDITPTATQTKSGRQVNRPSLYVPPAPSPGSSMKSNHNTSFANSPDNSTPAARKRKRIIRKGKEFNVNCVHCQRGHSPLNNAIVFCDWCNKAWHQLCHDPCIDDEVTQVKEKEWLCKQCKPVPLSGIQPTVVRSNPNMECQGRIPVKVPPLEVGGAGFSNDERRGYLSSLSYAALVELLVTLSDRNPDIPMFPDNLKALPSSKLPFQSSISTATPTMAIAGNGHVNGKQQDPSTTAKSQLATGKKRHDFSEDEESEYEIFEDHRLYPRAGNGFRLSLNQDDLDILREDPACPTFSYSLHGSAKARLEANDAPVWGMT